MPGGTATACENEGVQLNANTGGFSYEWTRGGSTIFGWKDSSVIVKNSGVYAVKVRSSDGCVSVSSSITVNILPSPIPVITKSGLTLGTVGTYASYQWIRNGVDIVGSTSSTHSLVYKGYYKVRVKDGNGCEGESNPIEITDPSLQDSPTGIGNVGMVNEQIKLYPNPSKGEFIIEIQDKMVHAIEVSDLSGRRLYSTSSNQDKISVDLSSFANGVYYVKVSSDKQQEVIKIVKQ